MTKETRGKFPVDLGEREDCIWNSMTHLAIKENHTNEREKWMDNFMMRNRKSVQSVEA